MKINKKYIFKRYFKEEAKELEEKTKAVKMLNETLNAKKIELKDAIDRANKFIEENTLLRHENGELRNDLKKAKQEEIQKREEEKLKVEKRREAVLHHLREIELENLQRQKKMEKKEKERREFQEVQRKKKILGQEKKKEEYKKDYFKVNKA